VEKSENATGTAGIIGERHGTVDNRLERVENPLRMGKVIMAHFEQLIDRFVASGRFNNTSEVIRAGLRLPEEHEAKASAPSREDLGRLIQTALRDRRPSIPANKFLRCRQGNLRTK
jgi:antitoxin ParD1/3/4